MLLIPRSFGEEKVGGCAILRSLYHREINGSKKRLDVVRATYQTVYPNCSIIDVTRPAHFLRKFSPDGRHLLAFSNDLTDVQIYDYLGCSMAVDLLKNFSHSRIEKEEGEEDYGKDFVRDRIFNVLFQLKRCIRVSSRGEMLVKTCGLFTNNSHVLVVSRIHRHLSHISSHNEFLNPVLLTPLEDYTLYLIDIIDGTVNDKLCFKYDKIYFNYNLGVYLFNDILVILSIYYQTIHVYKINDNRFNLLRRIGQYCHEDDHYLIEPANSHMNNAQYMFGMDNLMISGLKHKLMVSLYKKAEHETRIGISNNSLRIFYKNFNQYFSLRMWRLQLLDENHLFIRYASEAVATIKISNPNAEGYTEYFMVYDMTTNMILDVFDNTSDELLNMYENFCDDFRNPTINPEGFIPSSISNNQYSNQLFQFSKRNTYAVNGRMKGNKIILNHLPVSAQSFSSSPYLDKSFFSFDDFRISSMQAPKLAMKRTIKFYSKKSGLPSFSLYTGKGKMNQRHLAQRYHFNSGLQFYSSRMVEFLFHPTEPFALSVVSDRIRHTVNVHIRQVFMPE